MGKGHAGLETFCGYMNMLPPMAEVTYNNTITSDLYMFTRMLHPMIFKKLAGLYVKQFKNVLVKKKYAIQPYHVMAHGSGVVMRR